MTQEYDRNEELQQAVAKGIDHIEHTVNVYIQTMKQPKQASKEKIQHLTRSKDKLLELLLPRDVDTDTWRKKQRRKYLENQDAYAGFSMGQYLARAAHHKAQEGR